VLFRGIEIFDILGKLVHSVDFTTHQQPRTNIMININNLPIGTYNCIINYDQQKNFIPLIKK
jgi:hypothetical protein